MTNTHTDHHSPWSVFLIFLRLGLSSFGGPIVHLGYFLNVLARLTATAPPLSVETSLQLKVAPVANTARYYQLRTTDEESRLPDLEIRNDIL